MIAKISKHFPVLLAVVAATDIASQSVDVIVTDPPFFDNVHYSQLADFFYVWLQSILAPSHDNPQTTTRHPAEVQHTEAPVFAARLAAVLGECHRVLKQTGILVFTYHHTRVEGWEALYRAVRTAGFVVTKTHPVKAEMAVSVSIQQTKVTVNIDLIIVCRKDERGSPYQRPATFSIADCLTEAGSAVAALQETGMNISRGDVRMVVMGCLFSQLACLGNFDREVQLLSEAKGELDTHVDHILGSQRMNRNKRSL